MGVMPHKLTTWSQWRVLSYQTTTPGQSVIGCGTRIRSVREVLPSCMKIERAHMNVRWQVIPSLPQGKSLLLKCYKRVIAVYKSLYVYRFLCKKRRHYCGEEGP